MTNGFECDTSFDMKKATVTQVIKMADAANRAREAIGCSELARILGLTRQAVSVWDIVPSKHVPRVSKLSGIPCEELRPDIYIVEETETNN